MIKRDESSGPTTNRVAAMLGGSTLLRKGVADVSRVRRRTTQRRLLRAILIVYGVAVMVAYFELHGGLHLPGLPPNADIWGPGAALVVLFAIVLLVPMEGTGRSPHVNIRSAKVPSARSRTP